MRTESAEEETVRITLAAEYGIRGLTYLAMADRRSPVTIDEIARVQQIPKNYLIKIFKALSIAGIIRSHKGFGGGFSLARPAEEISMRAVFHVLQQPLALIGRESCLYHPVRCSEASGPTCCRFLIDRARRELDNVLEGTTLRDAARAAQAHLADGDVVSV